MENLVYAYTLKAKCNDGIDRPQFMLCLPEEVELKLAKLKAMQIPFYTDPKEYQLFKEGNHPLFQWAKK